MLGVATTVGAFYNPGCYTIPKDIRISVKINCYTVGKNVKQNFRIERPYIYIMITILTLHHNKIDKLLPQALLALQ
jgi:hypothetical protein